MLLADRVSERSREAVRTADPVTMEEFGYLLGQSTGVQARTKSGVTISTRRALGISSWYSGVLHISSVIAGLPFHRYRTTGEERERVADPDWYKRPDVEQPWYGLVEFMLMSLLHRGNTYAFKLRSLSGQVIGLREIHPDRVTVGQAPDGTKRFLVDRNEREYTTREILHVPGLSHDCRFGLNPIQYNADTLGAVAATDEYASRFFSNGTNLGGIISVQEAMTQDEAKDLRQEWEAFHQGLLNAHTTGVLSKGAVYNRLALNAEDTQLLESRQYGVTEVARLLRLPPHKLYELSRATFSNIEQQSIEAVQDCYQPWCERIEAHINFDPDLTPVGTYHEFVLEGRLRGDTASEYAALASATGRPWMALNEARRIKNLPSIAGGDDVLQPLAMTTTSDVGGADPREIAEIVQKVYLGVVNGVLTAREGRELLIQAGADIPPDFPGGGK